jgi:nicotinate dehydrogenase subunit B
MVAPTTRASPDEAITSGSLSVQHSGAALRFAAAHLREACRARLAQREGVAPEAVRLDAGVFEVAGVRAGYGELADAAQLAQAVDPSHVRARAGRPSALGDMPRSDIARIVFGESGFIQDLMPPGVLFGQVFRPRTLQADVDEAVWELLQQQLRSVPGVTDVVRDGLLVGVLASSEFALLRVAERVQRAALFSGQAQVPAPHELFDWLRTQPLDTGVVEVREAPAASAVRVFRAEYGRGWLQHASIGLCCAVAQWRPGELHVWSHTQGIFNLRRDLSLAFGLQADAVSVCHVEGAGCYGHNGADDVAFDAAWLARHAQGRPVRVQWTRQQEMANAPLGPAMVVAVEASVDAGGRLVAWKQDVWSQGHGTRPGRGGTPSLLGAWQTAQPAPVPMAVNAPLQAGGGSDRNSVPPYRVPRLEVSNHRVLSMPLRVSALRALGAHVNVLAAESMLDEIAGALQRDPLAYRLEHLDDPRACAVLQEVGRLAGWDLVVHERPAAAHGVLHVRQVGRFAVVLVVLAAHRQAEAVARRHDDGGGPDLDVQRPPAAGLDSGCTSSCVWNGR